MTLHLLKFDDRTAATHADAREEPAGWEIAPGDADDVRACKAHPWQSQWLVFADGRMVGTPLHPSPQYHGDYFSWLLIHCSNKLKEVAHSFMQAKFVHQTHA
jgi:hypothetical protein